jgi:phosphate transport system protein
MMRKVFIAELQAVGDSLIEMASLVERAVVRAGRALEQADLNLSERVITGDQVIDDLQRSIDDRCVDLLARQQPVASDLRLIVSALRMSMTLERMGDLARHVAQVARSRYPELAIHPAARETISKMVEAARVVSEEVGILLETRDLEQAAQIKRDDDVLDDLHGEIFALLLGPDWDGTVQEVLDLNLVSRYLERFGDHATTLAGRVEYLVGSGEGQL